ncbi:tryptophanyl-tRNA synthetase [Histomonas meleagridis]|uniref:tryptophanyl-tRNA synthetase n=1 Tax=Histomonas meleagridis TaxID=135588 RepID=UPI00355A6657|nr:tryptophanyl-tRNA synthetase [Histomonas meleagridis]KAH0802094.1 tryptophanyl-tRNA synthetase [Histomonas meleagridis]
MAQEQIAVNIESLYPSAEALGAKPFTEDISKAFTEATGKQLPLFIRRGIFNAQIDFDDAIKRKKEGKPFYLFLSITPTERLFNLRHIVMFQLAKELQEAFDCQLVIHVLDTKAMLRDPTIKWTTIVQHTKETIKDILSFGFNEEKTVLVKNSEALSLNYVYLCDLQRKAKLGDFNKCFIANDGVSIALLDTIFQNACFAIPKYIEKIIPNHQESRCLMLLRGSQKNLFDFIPTLEGNFHPMAVFGGFVPALQSGQKMPSLAAFALGQTSGSKGGKPKNIMREYMTIYLKDTLKQITTKLNKSAFSGGKDTIEEQREKGANLDVDVSFYYLRIFEKDDDVFENIRRTYGPGELTEGNDKRMLTGHLKKKCGEVITSVIKDLQNSRAKVTDEMIAKATAIRSI